MKEWLGRSYDPETFSVERTNRHLAKIPWPSVSVPRLGRILAALHRAKS